MASFSDLPNELVAMVWGHVLDPDAIESFALISKNVYALGSSYIREHNELKREFSSISVSEEDADTRVGHALEGMLLNPRAALYVRRIYIDGWRSEWDRCSIFTWPALKFRPHIDFGSGWSTDLFEAAVETSPFVPGSELEDWLDDLESGDEGTIIALMIMRLPNLRSFELSRVSRDPSRIPDVVRRIAASSDTDALSRLTEVRLGSGRCMESAWADDDWEDIFLQLPSVKETLPLRAIFR